jgi:hypothetical protein
MVGLDEEREGFNHSHCLITTLPRSKRTEKEIRKEAIEFDHDAGGDGEPDRGKHRCGGEKLFHGLGGRGWMN